MTEPVTDRPRLLRVLVPAALVGLAATLVLLRLDEPARIFFDETYYVNDARTYLQTLIEDGFAVHPPVGKWLIAAGIALFGDHSLGWRIAGAVEAAVTVGLVYHLGLRLFRRMWPAAVAGLLLATDGLWIAQARTSMLDIHLAFFVVLGAWLLVLDRDRTRPARTREAGQLPGHRERERMPRRGHLLRVLAGVAFGLAVATKWSGVLALIAGIVVTVVWEIADRRRILGRIADLWPAVASVVVTLGLVPIAVYFLAWTPWLVGFEAGHEGQKVCGETPVEACEVGLGERVAGLGRAHVAIARFHLDLDASHTYRADAYTWPVLARPVVYYWENCTEERYSQVPSTGEDGEVTTPDPCVVDRGEGAEVLAVGNPALWWTFLPATVLIAAGLVRRDGRAGVVAAFWGVQFLPWLLVSRPAFLFYMVPVVPFLALGVAYGTVHLSEQRPVLWPGMGAVVGATAGMLMGLGLERLPAIASPDARWIALGLGWLAGAMTGAWLHRRTSPHPRRERSDGVLGRAVAAAVVVAAVALLVFFYPVWTGLAMDADAVRARWWFQSWI